jgi:hypothetical protein
MNTLPRWFMAFVLIMAVVGLLLWARGPDHHHGDDVGSLGVPAAASQRLEG